MDAFAALIGGMCTDYPGAALTAQGAWGDALGRAREMMWNARDIEACMPVAEVEVLWDDSRAADQERPGLLECISLELLASTVCPFLTMNELSKLSQSSKALYHHLGAKSSIFGPIAWHLHREMWGAAGPTHRDMLKGLYHHYLMELQHVQNNRELFQALQHLPARSVRGMVASLVKFPTAAIARAVAVRRRSALSSVVVDSQATALLFRHANPRYRGAVSFIAVRTAVLLEPPLRPQCTAPGFVGYALDLLELRPEDEDLRTTVFASYVLRDMAIWETDADVRAALESGAWQPDSQPPFYALLSCSPIPRNHLDNNDGPLDGQYLPMSTDRNVSLSFRSFRTKHYPSDVDVLDLERRLQSRVDALRSALGWVRQ